MYRTLPARPLLLAALLAVPCFPLAALAQEEAPAIPSPAQRLAAACTNCHGPDGRSRQKAIPALAGEPAADLRRKLAEFRAGTARATVMTQLARAYSADELEQLADYFAAQPSP